MSVDWSQAPKWAQWWTSDHYGAVWWEQRPRFDPMRDCYMRTNGQHAMRDRESHPYFRIAQRPQEARP